METVNVRNLNNWLKANVPFWAKARRYPHCEIVITCDIANNLHEYGDAIRAMYPNNPVHAYGHRNTITVITLN